jgi:tRNA (cmo5U34)-methyltransferase
MSDFDSSQWADSEFSQEYRNDANDYLPERFKLIEMVKSFFRHFIHEVDAPRVLDLGCGDGLLMQQLMRSYNRIRATLVDGFPEMLESAKKRLADFPTVQFVQATFQDLLVDDSLPNSFDFILSSFAIHHLEMQEKKAFFEYIYHHLRADGFFLNLDVVLAPYQDLEDWYLSLWREWMSGNPSCYPYRNSIRTIQTISPTHYHHNWKHCGQSVSRMLIASINTVSSRCLVVKGEIG